MSKAMQGGAGRWSKTQVGAGFGRMIRKKQTGAERTRKEKKGENGAVCSRTAVDDCRKVQRMNRFG